MIVYWRHATLLVVRSFTDDEQAAITAGLRAADAFTLRRCQILSASAAGKITLQIAADLLPGVIGQGVD